MSDKTEFAAQLGTVLEEMINENSGFDTDDIEELFTRLDLPFSPSRREQNISFFIETHELNDEEVKSMADEIGELINRHGDVKRLYYACTQTANAEGQIYSGWAHFVENHINAIISTEAI